MSTYLATKLVVAEIDAGSLDEARGKLDEQLFEAGFRTVTYTIGDIAVIVGEPPNGNPYRGESLIGPARADALRRFHDGEDTTGLTFWYAPATGGARRLVDALDNIDWKGLR